MADPPPSFFRDRWLRYCLDHRRAARETDDPAQKAKLRGKAKEALRNAKEYRERVRREGAAELATGS